MGDQLYHGRCLNPEDLNCSLRIQPEAEIEDIHYVTDLKDDERGWNEALVWRIF